MKKDKIIHKYKDTTGGGIGGGPRIETMIVEEADYIEPILTDKEIKEKEKFEEMVDVLYYFQSMFEPELKVDTVIATTQHNGYFVEIKRKGKKEVVNFHIDKDLITDGTNQKWPEILKGFELRKITFKEYKNERRS